MLVVCCVFSHANNQDHGNCRGNTAWALAQWQHLVASPEATDALQRAMLIALYRPGGIVIDIAIKLVTFAYIIDNSAGKKNTPSFLQFSSIASTTPLSNPLFALPACFIG
jgi:hypothetical protein